MEAISSSLLPPRFAEIAPSRHSPISSALLKAPNFLCGFSRTLENFNFSRLSTCETSSRRYWSRFGALPGDDTRSSGGDDAVLRNGSASVPDFDLPLLESDSSNSESHELGVTEKSDAVIPVTGGSGTSGSRAGLFRTPISGGVQSATSAHDLPPPALAVRNLMEQARFAHLCTVMSRMHHRRAGYPFGSLVDFAPDSMGHPIFSLSPLAIHTRNLLADPRCTLVVQIPGWSGLSNARVTIFGDIVPLPAEQQEWARQQYISKHQQWASQKWGNFYYYRMQNISDIYFIGGFGTVAWVDVKEYEALQPDKIAADGGEQNLKELNTIFSKPLKELLSTEVEIDDAALISIDSKGTDIRVRQGAQFNIQRLSFEVDHGVETLEEAKKALQDIINRSCRSRSHERS
ncbi:uncharacterized protein [Typha angustifolia]|uniref:uncharacterized protein isoform X1 n=1 Tax=Typha angustifolia TaxID=59011 RepID=UPI003C2CD5F4